MNNELLTCIILTYNNGSYLLETIDSIIEQDYANIEIIVAEDGSKTFDKDSVDKYISSKKKHNIKNYTIICNETNLGTVKNVNNAIKQSRGAYIKIIAGDDTFPSHDVFSRQVEGLENRDSLFVVNDIISCDDKMNERYRVGFKYCRKDILKCSRKELYKYLVFKELGVLATQACCFKREFFYQFGLYDERYVLLEDMPMEKKIVLSNIEINYFSFPAVCHRGDVGTSTSSIAFDARKKTYYLDLYNEAVNNYLVDSGTLGTLAANMRKRLCKYRLDMCDINENTDSRLSKLHLTIKNIIPLIWHISKHGNSLKVYGKSFISTIYRGKK